MLHDSASYYLICLSLDNLKWCRPIWYFNSKKIIAPLALAADFLSMSHFHLSETLPFFYPGYAPDVPHLKHN